MKPSSASPKKISPAKARNAMLMNQLATPGLGSLMAGRWAAGTGQLICSTAGCVLVFIWFIKLMLQYYGQIDYGGGGGITVPGKPVAWMGWLGSALFVVSWFWSGITSLSLMAISNQSQAQVLEQYAENLTKLDEAAIIASLVLLPQWTRTGPAISRVFEFKDFPAAMKFVNAVAELAEQAGHHPDIDIRWNKVTLSLVTHDAGGLTSKDFTLARNLDLIALGAGNK
jgi:4a-hydroxytetrahydrobiopterin dehydratase